MAMQNLGYATVTDTPDRQNNLKAYVFILDQLIAFTFSSFIFGEKILFSHSQLIEVENIYNSRSSPPLWDMLYSGDIRWAGD